jgi:DNA replication protein DnaC
MTTRQRERIESLCSEFRLPTVAAEVVARFQAAEHGKALETLLEVFELEAGDRRQRREDRLRRAAKLPAGKTWDTLDTTRFPLKLQQQLDELSTAAFLERAVNVLAFGLPGTGKTHAMAALGYRLIEQGHSVLFAPTYKLVQDLLAAKRDLELPRALRKLDHFEVLILDDLGYLKHRADEAEVLFTQSPMATAAAIDRIVHHSVIAEFDVTSYRTAEAQKQGKKTAPPAALGRRAQKSKNQK